MQAYLFVETRVGKLYSAVEMLRQIEGVVSAHATFGPYELIALVEAEGLDELSDLVVRQIHGISEIIETTTCVLF